ncbi:MAG: flagellar basal body rod protein FlgC [Oscillospiraceae bacterium]|nr:flagellar basal body rod protein FlgC [Oscillospiraceae bacterium]
MAFLSSLNIPLSGITAQRFRLDIISQNVDNAHNFYTTAEEAYKRQMVVFEEDKTFKRILRHHMGEGEAYMFKYKQLKGVMAARVVDDPTPPEPVYSPNNPLADEFGYVYEANVDVQIEEMDAMEAQRSLDANVAMYQAMQSMIQASLSLGKG